jgi:hypothetical protein
MASDRRRSESSYRRLVVAVVLASVTLIAPTQAEADNPPPEDIPAVGAYVELVPSAGGSRQAGRRQRERGLPLPTGVSRRLDQAAGTDAPLLKRLATSADLGAPTRRLPLRDPTLETGANDTDLAASLGSVGQTLASGSDRRLLLLLAAMAAIVIGVLAASLRRARQT